VARFTGIQDFFGTFEGRYDGRRARLVVSDIKGDSLESILNIRFTDLDRNETYVSNHNAGTDPSHVLRGIKLKRQGGNATVSWPRLMVHTWDVRYLSGESEWNGKEFGMFYTRQAG
jgi:hypothetical protein